MLRAGWVQIQRKKDDPDNWYFMVGDSALASVCWVRAIDLNGNDKGPWELTTLGVKYPTRFYSSYTARRCALPYLARFAASVSKSVSELIKAEEMLSEAQASWEKHSAHRSAQ